MTDSRIGWDVAFKKLGFSRGKDSRLSEHWSKLKAHVLETLKLSQLVLTLNDHWSTAGAGKLDPSKSNSDLMRCFMPPSRSQSIAQLSQVTQLPYKHREHGCS